VNAPETVSVWVCEGCGHWHGSSVFPFDEDSLFRARCASCDLREMTPCVYSLAEVAA
jgi:hypothetical protein